ncbi:hypothetical protein [Tsukamurella tyrosinosolvens]|uniref:hypothetical protein n=1 Tax=Tsukamurella tyrosinosolvens TaxID=57704 RepID=UPI003461F258
MSASKLDVQPGWRGTDPDGGTWVRLTRRSGHPWLEITATGGLHFRTQEEAEAAGLVPLEPQRDRAELLAEAVQVARTGTVGQPPNVEGVTVEEAADIMACALLAGAAPAPLDPGNPEDLREVDKFLGRFYASIGIASSSAGSVCKQLRSVADRLDREQREAEQDAADRKRAEEYARTRWEFDTPTYWECAAAYLAGIRAERARAEHEEEAK